MRPAPCGLSPPPPPSKWKASEKCETPSPLQLFLRGGAQGPDDSGRQLMSSSMQLLGCFVKRTQSDENQSVQSCPKAGPLSRQMGELESGLRGWDSPPLITWPVSLPFLLPDPPWGRKWPGHALSQLLGKTEAKRGGFGLPR